MNAKKKSEAGYGIKSNLGKEVLERTAWDGLTGQYIRAES